MVNRAVGVYSQWCDSAAALHLVTVRAGGAGGAGGGRLGGWEVANWAADVRGEGGGAIS